MKKTPFFIILAAAALFFACEAQTYDVKITNRSSKTVQYSYDDHEHSLAPGKSRRYDAAAYTEQPGDVKVVEGDVEKTLSVVMEGDGADYTFVDATGQLINGETLPLPVTMKVINTLPMTVTIRAGAYIDAAGSEGKAAYHLKVPPSAADTPTEAKIYTRMPSFKTVEAPYDVAIEWDIDDVDKDDRAKDIMYVTLK